MSRLYVDLLRLVEREVALAREGRWEELPAALEARARLAEALPPRPPASARAPLERIAELHTELQRLLLAGRAHTARELGQLQRGRGAVRGYGAYAAAPSSSRVDGAA